MANTNSSSKQQRPVKDEESGRTREMRESPKRAGSTGKPADAGRYSTQTKK